MGTPGVKSAALLDEEKTIEALAKDFAKKLKGTNPLFDYDYFLRACEVPSYMNDQGASFKDIADWIEENL